MLSASLNKNFSLSLSLKMYLPPWLFLYQIRDQQKTRSVETVSAMDSCGRKTTKHVMIPHKHIDKNLLWVTRNYRLSSPSEINVVIHKFQPVLHDWCNKGRGMCYLVCGMVHIKEPLLLIGKSSLCGGSGFPFSLSEWSVTTCLTPYNRK